jgi:hypothetical protein
MSVDLSVAETLYQEDLYQIPPKFLILLPKPWDQVSETEASQLSKILAAVKLNLASVQVLTKEDVTLESLMPFSPQRIISFGVPFEPAIKPYENTERNGTKIIYADSLDSLDDIKKRNLWLAMKAMFGV